MSAAGWQVRHDATWPTADKWLASNLDTTATVFGATRSEVTREIAAYEGRRAPNARWIARTGSR